MGQSLCCVLLCGCLLVAVTGNSRAQEEAVGSAGRQSAAIPAADILPAQEEMLLDYLKKHHQPAVDFVVSQFEKHDLILVGETHQVAENCQFVASLIEPMYHAGVRVLVLEFNRSRFNDDLHRLTTSPTFDEDLLKHIFRQSPWATWGFQEYAEVHRAAWRLNRSLPPDAPQLRVIGIDSEWSQHALPLSATNNRSVRSCYKVTTAQLPIGTLCAENWRASNRLAPRKPERLSMNIAHGYLSVVVLASCLLPAAPSAASGAGETSHAPHRTFYVDSKRGEDGNDGLSVDNAWQTLERLNAAELKLGDTVQDGDRLSGIGETGRMILVPDNAPTIWNLMLRNTFADCSDERRLPWACPGVNMTCQLHPIHEPQ